MSFEYQTKHFVTKKITPMKYGFHNEVPKIYCITNLKAFYKDSFMPQTKLFKKSLIEKYVWPNIINEDFFLFSRLIVFNKVLYINKIFLGNQSFGIEAAARNYFRKPARNLTISQRFPAASRP